MLLYVYILRALYYRGLEQEVQQPGDNSFFQQLVQNKLKLNQDILSAIQEKVIHPLPVLLPVSFPVRFA